MTDTTASPSAPSTGRRPAAGSPPSSTWLPLLGISALVIAGLDLVFLALIAEIVPPLVVGAVLSLVGVVVLRVRPRVGIVVLGLTTVVMLLGSLPFAVDHLAHPDSGIDWAHAVIGIAGRFVVLAAVVGAWRTASDASARRAGVGSLALLGLVAAVALVATVVTSGDDLQPGDVVLDITATEFPEILTVQQGDVLYVDNQHMFRHTFTVEGTDIDVALPALQGIRVPIDLPPGTYELICDVPGHDAMTGQLVVEPRIGA
jgi:plastocyanin